jgi:pyruvate,water dikinase
MPYTLPLTALNRIDLPRAGGKGANLGEMLQAQLPVPPGFCVLTDAYRAFVAANGLADEIQQCCAAVDLADPATLDTASAAIRAGFARGQIASELSREVEQAYRALGENRAVAVRSSATAEDLPDLSFAGQQDTFLNMVGETALLQALVRCWSSLWTARAIGYRARNQISHSDVALAVVVQVMVPSEASGVLFTVNPLSGRRTETVIDATFGLGEALVSGQVEPDQYTVVADQIVEKRLGAKALSIRGQAGGGTTTITEQAADRQALPDEAILALTGLGRQAAAHFGSPQDIEWAWSDGKMWLVQSRPITSLFPLPENPRGPDHLLALINFGAVQGIMDPLTPLGRDVFRYLATSGSRLFGGHWTPETQKLLYESAERLFIDFNGAIRHPLGRNIARYALPIIEPASVEALGAYWDDPRLAVGQGWDRHTKLRLMRLMLPNLARVLAALAFPAARRHRIQTRIEKAVAAVYAQRAALGNDPSAVPAFAEETLNTLLQRLFLWLVSIVAAGQIAFQGLRRLASELPDGERLALEVTRGLPHNVTTEMDLVLWDTAQAIRGDPVAAAYFQSQPAATLAADFQAARMPPVAQAAVQTFMDRYGMRGVGEIDLGRKRWREDPTSVMQSLNSYLQITRPEAAPAAVFARGAAVAQQATEQIATQLRRTKGGWWKAPLARFLASRTRELTGLRESPKLTIIRIFGEIRLALLSLGSAAVSAGWLSQPEDITFLRFAELRQLAGQLLPSGSAKRGAREETWSTLVAARRAVYEREQRRRQSPRLLMGDGTAVYEGVGGRSLPGDKVLVGSPVSPGQVEGIVHVVFDPHGAQLAPGEILVCPGTDPAWTPLFLSAGGLVMEVGGLMTHGSVVAREYGIPAVVGVGEATLRLKTGQRIRVDGSAGRVELLD